MKPLEGRFLGNIFYGAEEPLKFSQYWNQVTPENAGKWGSVESSRDQMNFGTLDYIYNYAKQHGMPFKFHVLVWGQQQPSWISGLSTSEQRAEVEEWFAAVADRYADIDMIDVVNEPLHSPPPYRDALGGDGSTGWDWVITSFQLAREYFPDSTLLINEYGIISDPSAAQRYIQIIDLLTARGLVDGIGIQCHAFNMDSVSVSTMEQVLDMLAQTGLPIYVSELDMRGDDQTQLQRYQEKFPVLWEHPSVRGVTLWGYVEGHIWQSEAYLLHSDGTERPALSWLMQYVYGD
ncbi:endo-1,4-beta-xylanase [Spirochaeta thermophila]|nr:endo-1,4-beta-xylanase [Spirochaeta thermophila]